MANLSKNPDIGTCPCITCGVDSPLRKDAGKNLYVTCKQHGKYAPKDPEWILDNATMWPLGVKPADPEPIPDPDPGPDPDPAETLRFELEPDPDPIPEPDPDPIPDANLGKPGHNFRKYLQDLDSNFEEFFSK